MDVTRQNSLLSDAVAIQRSFINGVFFWMTAGLTVTGASAWYTAAKYGALVLGNSSVFYILLIAEVLLAMGLSAAIRVISPAVAVMGFILFAVLNGVMLSWLFLVYSTNSITTTFLSAGITFGVMGLYGWLTKRDLTSAGSLLVMGLSGLIIAGIVNLFWRNPMFDLISSAIGILIFVGLTAYDAQKIKNLSIAVAEGKIVQSEGRKLAIFGALELYLDFINLFLYLLRFSGNRK